MPRGKAKKKFKPERIVSPGGYGHATQAKHNHKLYQVFFHADKKLGSSLHLGTVDRETALVMLDEMDETGADFHNPPAEEPEEDEEFFVTMLAPVDDHDYGG